MKKKVTKGYIFTKKIDGDSLDHESFIDTIVVLKENALQHNVILNDKDIATAIGITEVQFEDYLKNEGAPKELFVLLRSTFKDHLKDEVYKVEFNVKLPDPFFDQLIRKLDKKK